jgi:hypothetical protein
MLLAVAIVVLKVVALFFQRIERFIGGVSNELTY